MIRLREENNRNREIRALNRRFVEDEEENEFVFDEESEDEDISFETISSEIKDVAFLLEETQMMINIMIKNKKCMSLHDKQITQQIINLNVEMRRRFEAVCEKRSHLLSLLIDANLWRINH